MARTLSVTDEESGVTASMRVEEVDGQSRITSLHFDAVDGFGITAEHLRIVQDFGLQLPTALPVRAPHAAAAPVAVESPAPAPKKPIPPRQRTKAAKAAPKQRKRYEGGVPSDAALASMWAQFGGSAPRIAEATGANVATVYGWLSRARKRGVVVFAVEAPAAAVNGAVPAS